MNLLHKLRSRLSETYRIRNGFGIFPIRNRREARALYEFCMEQINNTPFSHRKFNGRKFQIYKDYCRLYRWEMGERKQPSVRYDGVAYFSSMDFAQDFAGWFWS